MPETVSWEPARLAHPWFARVSDLVARITPARDWPSIAMLNDCFADEFANANIRLVEAAKTRPALRDGTIDISSLYEVRIVDDGEIPTRPRNVHDLLNALVWAAFPKSKLALTRALAAIQRERAAGQTSLPNARTPAHDTLALLDEGAMLFTQTATWIFGHAIFEHAYAGNFDIRGAAVDLDVPGTSRAEVDRDFAIADFQRAVRRGAGIPISEAH